MINFLRSLFGFKKEPSWLVILGSKASESKEVIRYKKLGSEIGEIINMRYIGHAVSYSSVLDKLIKAEEVIAAMGFMPLPIGIFAYFADTSELLDLKYCEKDQKPILFAKLWKETNSEDSIFSNESLFQNERKEGGVIYLEANPNNLNIFNHETELIKSANISF